MIINGNNLGQCSESFTGEYDELSDYLIWNQPAVDDFDIQMALTAQDISEAAKRFIRPDRVQIFYSASTPVLNNPSFHTEIDYNDID